MLFFCCAYHDKGSKTLKRKCGHKGTSTLIVTVLMWFSFLYVSKVNKSFIYISVLGVNDDMYAQCIEKGTVACYEGK